MTRPWWGDSPMARRNYPRMEVTSGSSVILNTSSEVRPGCIVTGLTGVGRGRTAEVGIQRTVLTWPNLEQFELKFSCLRHSICKVVSHNFSTRMRYKISVWVRQGRAKQFSFFNFYVFIFFQRRVILLNWRQLVRLTVQPGRHWTEEERQKETRSLQIQQTN